MLVLAVALVAGALPLALRAAKRSSELEAARITVRSAIPIIEAYRADRGSYDGLTAQALTPYERDFPRDLALGQVTPATYCLMATVGSQSAHFEGPAGEITTGPCSAA